MKFIKSILFIAILAISVLSCQREDLDTGNNKNGSQRVSPTNDIGNDTSGRLRNYKASLQEIETAKQAWLKSIRNQNIVLSKGSCGEHVSETIIIEEAVLNSCGNYDITFLILSDDNVGSAYELQPTSADFRNLLSSP